MRQELIFKTGTYMFLHQYDALPGKIDELIVYHCRDVDYDKVSISINLYSSASMNNPNIKQVPGSEYYHKMYSNIQYRIRIREGSTFISEEFEELQMILDEAKDFGRLVEQWCKTNGYWE